MTENGAKESLPEFITFDSESNQMTINRATDDDLGVFTIQLEALLHDPDATSSQISFKITVEDPCIDTVINSDNGLVIEDFIAPDDVSQY